jgi:hypothetical protein
MRDGLFPQDDISKKSSTEFRSDLNFEGLRLGDRPGVPPWYASEPMAECIARLERTACPEPVEAAS